MTHPIIEAFRIEQCTMGGSAFLPTVYLDKAVATSIAQSKNEEFVDYKVRPVRVRRFGKTECVAVENILTLDETTEPEHARRNALKKLTPSDRKALGLTPLK
jgi:hypothetical protein